MRDEIASQIGALVATYDLQNPGATADGLRDLWLRFEPKSIAGIKAELREQQETVGIPVPVLKAIGKELSKVARKQVEDFVPLTRLLWDEYGREGRVVALIPLGAMELVAPDVVVPMLKEMGRTCITWEDSDRLAMDGLEPIVRKNPEEWLEKIGPWLEDESKWVRRAGVIVVGRLPMKHPGYARRCLEMTERLLFDEEVDVKKAVSFAIRLTARGDVGEVVGFLRRHVPPQNPVATWVVCDAIRSMAKKLLPEFVPLLPLYERWASAADLGGKDRRSVESAVKVLQKAGGDT
jgi:3-methyladenine DNA glycosylase AlkD